MARIRTIKPEFFRHESLFEAERETGLPLRLAFAGLWTAADREGRFRWAPRQLKLDCLPYDDVDFSRVLDALVSRGSIVKYAIDGKEYGCIPSWLTHQVINNRERPSDIPPPNEINDLTRQPRVNDASVTPLKRVQGEGKGKEGKGNDITSASRTVGNEDFETLKKIYPRRKGNYGWKAAERKFLSLVKTGVDPKIILESARHLSATSTSRIGTEFIPMPASWLNSEDFLECAVAAFDDACPPEIYENVL